MNLFLKKTPKISGPNLNFWKAVNNKNIPFDMFFLYTLYNSKSYICYMCSTSNLVHPPYGDFNWLCEVFIWFTWCMFFLFLRLFVYLSFSISISSYPKATYEGYNRGLTTSLLLISQNMKISPIKTSLHRYKANFHIYVHSLNHNTMYIRTIS